MDNTVGDILMLRIAVCDDNVHVCAQMEGFFASFLGDSIEYEVLIFNNGIQLLACGQKIDVLYLDVEMPYMDGFSAAEEFNRRSRDTRIIFFTNHSEMIQKAFKVKAFRYLIKPVEREDMEESLVSAISDINSSVKVMVDNNTAEGRTDIVTFEKEIICVEAVGDSSVIYTMYQGNLISRKPLKHWIENLTGTAFFQTHKSFIVSLAHVASIKKSFVVTTLGMEVPLAKRKMGIFKDYVAEYLKSM